MASNQFILREGASELEEKYGELYGSVINRVFFFTDDMMSNVKSVLLHEKAISEIMDHSESYQLAYLLLHGVDDTCLSVGKFHESFKDSQSLEGLCSKKQIRIHCLARESIFATIGVCRVIDEAVVHFGYLEEEIPIEIQVSINERREDSWERLCKFVVDAANSYCKGVELKLDFDKEDLALNECDIVIMAKFLSQFQSMTALGESVKKTLRGMKVGAILFYLDYESHGRHALLKYLITGEGSFIEASSSVEQYPSFDKPRCEQYCLDFSFTWTTIFPPIIFLSWIKITENRVENDEMAATKLKKKIRKKKSDRNQKIPPASTPKAVAAKPQNQEISPASTPKAIATKSQNQEIHPASNSKEALATKSQNHSTPKAVATKSQNQKIPPASSSKTVATKPQNQEIPPASTPKAVASKPQNQNIPPASSSKTVVTKSQNQEIPPVSIPQAVTTTKLQNRVKSSKKKANLNVQDASATPAVASSPLKVSKKSGNRDVVVVAAVTERIAPKSGKESKSSNKSCIQNQAKFSSKKVNQNVQKESASSSQNKAGSSKKSRNRNVFVSATQMMTSKAGNQFKSSSSHSNGIDVVPNRVTRGPQISQRRRTQWVKDAPGSYFCLSTRTSKFSCRTASEFELVLLPNLATRRYSNMALQTKNRSKHSKKSSNQNDPVLSSPTVVYKKVHKSKYFIKPLNGTVYVGTKMAPKLSKNPQPLDADGKIKLVGKFARMDLEKRYKNIRHRRVARIKSASVLRFCIREI